MQHTSVDLQGTSEAEAMETVQLSSHSNIPLRSVSGSVSSVPLIEDVYHFLNFLLSTGFGELFSTGCESGDECNVVPHCVEKCFILLPRLEFLLSKRMRLNSFQTVQPVPGTPASPSPPPVSLWC